MRGDLTTTDTVIGLIPFAGNGKAPILFPIVVAVPNLLPVIFKKSPGDLPEI
jgi:hypothetical protein